MYALNSRPIQWTVLGGAFLFCAVIRVHAEPAQGVQPLDDSTTVASDKSDDSSFDNVEIIDSGLKGKIAILRVGSEPSANNLLSVFAGLKNKTARSITVEVQTIYKDKDGTKLNSGSWVAITLKPHEDRDYRSTSISEKFDPDDMTDRFMIRIRRAAPAHG